jgi:hypothetical protein
MKTDQPVCGYALGRFVPSKGAFMARVPGGGDHPLCLLVVEPTDGVCDIGDTGFIDVGRLIDGSLIVIREIQLASVTTTDIKEIQTQLFERSSVSDAPYASTNSHETENLFGMNFSLAAVRVAIEERMQVLLSVLQKLTSGRGRLIVIFFSVGFVLTIAFALGLSGGEPAVVQTGAASSRASSTGIDNQRQQDGFNADAVPQAEHDAVSFALDEVHEGRGGIVLGDSAGRIDLADITARVVSRNGAIALVEVSFAQGGKKTFATLLLQKLETGWRTRDVFLESGG